MAANTRNFGWLRVLLATFWWQWVLRVGSPANPRRARCSFIHNWPAPLDASQTRQSSSRRISLAVPCFCLLLSAWAGLFICRNPASAAIHTGTGPTCDSVGDRYFYTAVFFRIRQPDCQAVENNLGLRGIGFNHCPIPIAPESTVAVCSARAHMG